MQYPIYNLITPKTILSKVKRNITEKNLISTLKHENDLIPLTNKFFIEYEVKYMKQRHKCTKEDTKLAKERINCLLIKAPLDIKTMKTNFIRTKQLCCYVVLC